MKKKQRSLHRISLICRSFRRLARIENFEDHIQAIRHAQFAVDIINI